MIIVLHKMTLENSGQCSVSVGGLACIEGLAEAITNLSSI